MCELTIPLKEDIWCAPRNCVTHTIKTTDYESSEWHMHVSRDTVPRIQRGGGGVGKRCTYRVVVWGVERAGLGM